MAFFGTQPTLTQFSFDNGAFLAVTCRSVGAGNTAAAATYGDIVKMFGHVGKPCYCYVEF
jgi:hypothetical protein